MEITEVRVKLVEKAGERLRAFCSITLDGDFVIRDLKIIDGANGAFVAMPSRKLADRCPKCGNKNHLRSKYCNECGQKLNENRAPKDSLGRAKLHADVAHPINVQCRERIQKVVIEAFQTELEKAKSPDYKPPAIDEYEDDFEDAPPAGNQSSEPVAVTKDRPRDPIKSDSSFSDYDSLIEDLKREAEGRRGQRDSARSRDTNVSPSIPFQKNTIIRKPSGVNEKSVMQSQSSGEKPDAAKPRADSSSSNDKSPNAVPKPSPSAPSGQSSSTNKSSNNDDDFGAGLV